MPSLATHLVNLGLRLLVKRDLARSALTVDKVHQVRRRLKRLEARRADHPGIRFEAAEVGGVPCEWVTPEEGILDDRVLVYLHGGAYAIATPQLYRPLTARLARATGARILVPDYRLAPEHPFPAAPDDALAVWEGLLASGRKGRNTALAGDSAGGNLVLVLLQRIRAAGLPLPAGAACLSPWGDLTGSGDSHVLNARRDPMLPAHKLEEAAALYAPDADLRDPLLSPVFADYRGLPPLQIHVGSTEILLDDALRITRAAERAGVPVHLKVWASQPHVFPMIADFIPEGREAIADVARFTLGNWIRAMDRALRRARSAEADRRAA
jgi:acetyl esterase/lipase